jgi:hypothetical protein
MTIALMILKIIGWILLILLLLVLVLLLLVLFVPVRYRASAKMQEQLQARVRASWLFPVISFGMEYAGTGLVGRLRIFGIPVMKFPKSEEEAEESEAESESADDSTAEAEPTVKNENKFADDEVHVKVDTENDPESDEKLNPQEDSENNPKSKKKRVFIARKVHDIFEKISDILKNIRGWVEKIKALISDEKNQSAFSHLKQELIYLLKKSVPRKMHVQATFSTGSPDTTGEVLGVIAMFPAAYKNRWNIVPDFEADHFYVEGEAELSGRIFIYQLAGIILRILKDRNCRRLFKKLKG